MNGAAAPVAGKGNFYHLSDLDGFLLTRNIFLLWLRTVWRKYCAPVTGKDLCGKQQICDQQGYDVNEGFHHSFLPEKFFRQAEMLVSHAEIFDWKRLILSYGK